MSPFKIPYVRSGFAAMLVIVFFTIISLRYAQAVQEATYIYEVTPIGWQCGTAEPAANIIQAKFEPENSTGKIRVTVAKCDGSQFTKDGTIQLIQDDTGEFKNYQYHTATTDYRCGDIVEFRLLPRNDNFELRGTVRKCDGGNFTKDGKLYVAADGNIIAGPEDYLAGNSSESIIFNPLQLNAAGRHTYQAYLQSDNNSPGDYIVSGSVDAWEEYDSYLSGSSEVQAGQSEVTFLFDPVSLGISGDWHKYQVHVYPSGQDYPIRSGIISARDVPAPQGDAFEPDNDFLQSTSIDTNGSSQVHTLHLPGDEDWVKFETQNGNQYVITTSNLQGGADTYIGLFWDENNDNHADLILTDDNSGGGSASSITWIAPRTGTHYVKIRDVNANTGGINVAYALQVTGSAPPPPQGDQYEPDNDFTQSKSITPDGSVQTHTIHVVGDEDWVKFEAQNGYQYVITTSNLQGGADTFIGLFWDENNDNHADLIVSDDDGAGGLASRIVWTAPHTGTYYVKVRDAGSNTGGANISYILQITGSAPQVDLYEYTSFNGDILHLYPYVGIHIALLVSDSNLDADTLGKIVSALDIAYEYYQQATGRTPSLYYQYDGRATVAVVPATCGAGCGYLGATGIELLNTTFEQLYQAVKNDDKYDQAVFYELGRNFWFYGDQIEYKGSDDTGAITTGYAVFMRFQSMEAASFAGAPFNGTEFSQFRTAVVQMVNLYLADPSWRWENTLKVGQAPANPLGLGATDLFASFLFELRTRYGDAYIPLLWREVERRPAANSTQEAVDNFVVAASIAAQQNLTSLFRDEWRWPVSSSADDKIRQALSQPAIDPELYLPTIHR